MSEESSDQSPILPAIKTTRKFNDRHFPVRPNLDQLKHQPLWATAGRSIRSPSPRSWRGSQRARLLAQAPSFRSRRIDA
jgi:hypothetical protein